MERYIAIFRKESDSDFGVEFPDVPGCFSAGSDLTEARKNAAEALRLHLDGLAEDGEATPSRRDAASVMAELVAEGIGDDFFALEEVEAEPPEEKVVRVNVTFTESALALIDRQAEGEHMTRSAYLAELARRADAPVTPQRKRSTGNLARDVAKQLLEKTRPQR